MEATMHDTIPNLVSIVKNATSDTMADKAISDAYPKLSTKSASNIRQDVQDFIEESMTESMLSYYLAEHGI